VEDNILFLSVPTRSGEERPKSPSKFDRLSLQFEGVPKGMRRHQNPLQNLKGCPKG